MGCTGRRSGTPARLNAGNLMRRRSTADAANMRRTAYGNAPDNAAAG
ncbi:hypothetical protein BIFBIF_00705 [Bifidobacterium bifidum ATCC 29521 = JCM 1255 = DSM 20456]|nr:hypothetical protein BIFBIF_00705 [Bifidobacterium bifidum ATCC 29521 = JCM 1255 = DSM 20456]